MCDSLNDAIEDNSKKVLQQNSAEIESFSCCSVPCQSNVFTVGRIRSENMAKLAPMSVILEGDRVHSYGRSVCVDLSDLAEYSLFPGQLIAMRDSNPSGKKFVATSLFSLPIAEGRIKIGGSTEFDRSNICTTIIGP